MDFFVWRTQVRFSMTVQKMLLPLLCWQNATVPNVSLKMESANINNQLASSTTRKFKSVRSQFCKINCIYSLHVSVEISISAHWHCVYILTVGPPVMSEWPCVRAIFLNDQSLCLRRHVISTSRLWWETWQTTEQQQQKKKKVFGPYFY